MERSKGSFRDEASGHLSRTLGGLYVISTGYAEEFVLPDSTIFRMASPLSGTTDEEDDDASSFSALLSTWSGPIFCRFRLVEVNAASDTVICAALIRAAWERILTADDKTQRKL